MNSDADVTACFCVATVLLNFHADLISVHSAMSGPLSQTMLAHRLMAKAQIVAGHKGQLDLLQAIFSAYHEQEMDIGSEDVLADLAEEQGILSRDEVRVVLRYCASRTCEFLILICVNPYRHFHSSSQTNSS